MVRATGDKKVIYSIQVLRATAAMLVVMRHIARRLSAGQGFEIGQCGVDIFFVISGFVIYLTGRNLGWSGFVRRRIARIVPLYWIVLAITVAIGVVRGAQYPLSNAILSFLFIPAHLNSREILPPVAVGWSLNFEAYFYLLFTLSLLLLPKVRPLLPVSLLIAAGCLAGPAVFDLANGEAFPPAVLLLPISLEFVAGMWLAERWSAGARMPSWCAVAVLLLAIAWFALAPSATTYTVAQPLYWGVPAVASVWASLNLETVIEFKRWRPVLVIGDASYALYLVHQLVLPLAAAILQRMAPGLPIAVVFVALIAGAIVAGVAAHYLVELPLLRWTNRLLGLRPATSIVGADSVRNVVQPAAAGAIVPGDRSGNATAK